MEVYNNISYEERIIINFIFKDLSICLKKVNLEKLIKTTSKHLLLPLLYSKLKKTKLINELPKELVDYLKNIYEINLKRNQELIKELKIISTWFNENKINFVFLKGSALIASEVFENIGERMIGDIDILVDKNKIHDAQRILKNNGYYETAKYFFFNERHLPRLAHKKKIFAVELHKEIVDKIIDKRLYNKKTINSCIFLKNSIPIQNHIDTYLTIIYNFLQNDYSSRNLTYNYRFFYDLKVLEKKYKINNAKINYNKALRKLNIISDQLNIRKSNNLKLTLQEKFFKKKFIYANKYKIIFKVNYHLNEVYYFLLRSPIRVLKIIKDKQYRNYSIRKILGRI